MPLTVRELTEIPYLRTRLLGGSSGAGNVIAWAHSIELPTPWEWLEAGDLLMTVGLGIPAAEAEQEGYVRELAAVGVSGVAIGEDMQAPPLSEAMVATADAVGLPLLITAYEVPFVQVSRAVAEANSDPRSNRAVRAARVYDRMREAVVEQNSDADLLAALEREVGCRLCVCANETSTLVMSGACSPRESLLAAFRDAVASHSEQMPGLLRLEDDGDPCLVVPVPARRPVSLLASPTAGVAPPYALLQHVATVVALQVERQWASREELRRTGAELFTQLLEGRVSGTGAAAQLTAHGLGDGPFFLLAAEAAAGTAAERWGGLHHALAELELPSLILRRGDRLDLLMPAARATSAATVDLLGPGATIGVSDPFSGADSVAGARREAQWALKRAAEEGEPILRYGDGAATFGPRSIAEAEAAIIRVLGPLLDYDAEHGGELVTSLRTFLAANRSWKRAAADLFIHKQTLVYRMRRVEKLTGRSLGDTDDVADLWLALKALEAVGVE